MKVLKKLLIQTVQKDFWSEVLK